MSDNGHVVTLEPDEKEKSFSALPREIVNTSISAWFEQVAEKFPRSPAVVDGAITWTYDELNQSANQIAHTLLASRGPQAEPVAVLFEQGAHFLAGLLGVLKAGKFYVPLDPLFPQTRNTYILNDSGAMLLLTDQKNLSQANELVNEKVQVLDMEAYDSNDNDTNPSLVIKPEALALFDLHQRFHRAAQRGAA